MNYAQYFALESRILKQGFELTRQEIILEFTAGKTDSLKALDQDEYKQLIKWLITRFDLNDQPASNKTQQQLQCQQMRKKIISLFHQMGYQLPNSTQINMKRVNDWCVQYGHKKMELNAHSYEELVKLCTQVEKVYKTFLKSI